MPKIRLYHVRALLWTYLAWAFLNLWYASRLHSALRGNSPGIPYIWALLHTLPWEALRDPDKSGLAAFGVYGLGGVPLVIVGLLMKDRWDWILIVMGMSLWFLTAWVLAGISV